MMHRQGAQRRFVGRTIQSDVGTRNRRIGMILLALIAVLCATAVIGVIVPN